MSLDVTLNAPPLVLLVIVNEPLLGYVIVPLVADKLNVPVALLIVNVPFTFVIV